MRGGERRGNAASADDTGQRGRQRGVAEDCDRSHGKVATRMKYMRLWKLMEASSPALNDNPQTYHPK